jgi:hypothetical protein
VIAQGKALTGKVQQGANAGERCTIARSVVVEGIGNSSGGRTAAPIAANMIVKARQNGLLGESLRSAPTNQQPNSPQPKPRRR